MKKFKELKIFIVIVVLLIVFAIVRLCIRDEEKGTEGIGVGSYSIDMYIKHKNGDLEAIDSAPKEGNYELDTECEGAKITWNNETHELTMSLKSNLEECKIIFNEI